MRTAARRSSLDFNRFNDIHGEYHSQYDNDNISITNHSHTTTNTQQTHNSKTSRTQEVENETKKRLAEKEGRCPECGMQTHKIKFWGVMKTKVPMTINEIVYRGRCLLCNPLEEGRGGRDASDETISFEDNDPTPIMMSNIRETSALEDGSRPPVVTPQRRRRSSLSSMPSLLSISSASSSRSITSTISSSSSPFTLSTAPSQPQPAKRPSLASASAAWTSSLSLTSTQMESSRSLLSNSSISSSNYSPPKKVDKKKVKDVIPHTIQFLWSKRSPQDVANALDELHRHIVFDPTSLQSLKNDECRALVAVIASTLSFHSKSPLVQERGCSFFRTLSQLSGGEGEAQGKFRRIISDCGAIRAVIRAMDQHFDVESMQRQGCGAIRNLALFSKPSVNTPSRSNSTLRVSQRNSHSESDTNSDDEENATVTTTLTSAEATVSSAARVIVNAMKRFVDNTDIQEDGCAALHNLAIKSSRDREVVASTADSLHAILFGMKKHVACKSLQKAGCCALQNMAYDNIIHKQEIVDGDGISIILTSMSHHVQCSDFQSEGCAALWNLGANSYENKELIAIQGGVHAAVRAMTFHEKDAKVQKMACALLNTLVSGSERVIRVLRNEVTREFLTGVAESYPDECGSFAWNVVDHL